MLRQIWSQTANQTKYCCAGSTQSYRFTICGRKRKIVCASHSSWTELCCYNNVSAAFASAQRWCPTPLLIYFFHHRTTGDECVRAPGRWDGQTRYDSASNWEWCRVINRAGRAHSQTAVTHSRLRLALAGPGRDDRRSGYRQATPSKLHFITVVLPDRKLPPGPYRNSSRA